MVMGGDDDIEVRGVPAGAVAVRFAMTVVCSGIGGCFRGRKLLGCVEGREGQAQQRRRVDPGRQRIR